MGKNYKHRRWEAFISVSSSGPEFSTFFEKRGRLARCRMAADLKYTTADADFLYDHFFVSEDGRSRTGDLHLRLVNPEKKMFWKLFYQRASGFKKIGAIMIGMGAGFILTLPVMA
jgi:hypothetical protein